MTFRRSLTLTVMAALAIAGCGSSDGDDPAPKSWNESDVIARAGLQAQDGGLTYRLKAHPQCVAAVILTTANEVELYGEAGDTVATNPDRTAGVKVTSDETATCATLFTEALRAVR